MSGRAFLLTTVAGLSVATMCLILAAVLDTAVLAVIGSLVILLVFLGRERWLHGGRKGE